MKKELNLAELKKTELNILKKFDAVCRENNLEYSLAYGTMLGAVRHKGFIPWDDDIDVFMKRGDYERLLKLEYKDDTFEIKSCRYSKNYFYLFSKMIDKTTELTESWRAEKDMGVYIDIFPLDFTMLTPDGNLEQKKQDLIKRNFKYFTLAGILGHKMSHHRAFSVRYFTKFLFKFVTLPFRKLILKKIDLMYAQSSGNYCFNMMGNALIPSELIDETVYCDFEGYNFPIYKEYDKILTVIYGDYMKLPPVEQQKSIHWFKAYKKYPE